MKFIKVLNTYGDLVSVEALEEPVYVMFQTRNNKLIRCSERLAQGILDVTGSTIYQLSERPLLPDAPDRTAVIITQAEYDELSQDYPEPNPQPDDPERDDPPLTVGEMRAKLAEQEATISMLTECLLEMSEIVYG